MTSRRGQRQPYRVCTTFPPGERRGRMMEGSRVVNSYVSLSDADHNAREVARYGATSEMLYLREDGDFLRLFVYTPGNVTVFDDDAERTRIYKAEDIIAWYRKHHGAPEPMPGLTVRNIRTADRPVPDGTPTDKTVPLVYPQDAEDEALKDFRRPSAKEERMDQPAPTVTRTRSIELSFDVENFPVVEAEHFKPVIADIMEVTLYPRPDGTLYIGRIQLRGAAAKKDGTPSNSPGNLWLRPDDGKVPAWLLDRATEQCAPYLALTSKESKR